MQAPGVPQRAAHSQPERYQNHRWTPSTHGGGQARSVAGIAPKRSHSLERLERGGATRPGEGWGEEVQEISGTDRVAARLVPDGGASGQGRASGSVDGVEALRVAFAGAGGAADRIFPVHREGVSARDARDYHTPNPLAAPPPVHPTPATLHPEPCTLNPEP